MFRSVPTELKGFTYVISFPPQAEYFRDLSAIAVGTHFALLQTDYDLAWFACATDSFSGHRQRFVNYVDQYGADIEVHIDK